LELLYDETTRTNWKIFVWDSNKTFKGFGVGTRKVFRRLAHLLRSMHNAEVFCGDLINRVSIRIPDLAVSFTAHPIIIKGNDKEINKGIRSDMVHFRYMVAKLMNDHLKKKGSETEFIELPIGFNLFFSRSFFSLPVKDGSFLQFFHPIFFNGEDRLKFINLVSEYRKTNMTNFDFGLNLGNTAHGGGDIENWTDKIPSGTLRDILQKSPRFVLAEKDNKYYTEIANYMRNVFAHYKDIDKVCNFNFFNLYNSTNKLC
jgi:hypothetical protein